MFPTDLVSISAYVHMYMRVHIICFVSSESVILWRTQTPASRTAAAYGCFRSALVASVILWFSAFLTRRGSPKADEGPLLADAVFGALEFNSVSPQD